MKQLYEQIPLDFTIAGRAVQLDMIVADIGNDAILGMDFIEKYKCDISSERRIITFHDIEVPLHKGEERVSCCRITADKYVSIASRYCATSFFSE